MQNDMRETPLYREAEGFFIASRQPGTGQISDASEIHPSPDGTFAMFTGTLVDKLVGVPATRICRVDLATGETRVMTFGPNRDRLPKYSPDGRHVAFLSDRHKTGEFQLYLLDPIRGVARATPAVEGWVEYLHWSPDGRRILLGVAGHGADVSGAQGAMTTKREPEQQRASWMPAVDSDSDESYQWRRLWVYDLDTQQVRAVTGARTNVWEAAWCGDRYVGAVISAGPSEGLWYTARLHVVEIDTGSAREVYTPEYQLGLPAGSPSGRHLAFVEAFCSDRWIVAGDLNLVDIDAGKVRQIDTRGIDVSCTEWRSDRKLLIAGHRGLETVVGVYDVVSDAFTEVWRSEELSTGGRFATISGIETTGDCIFVGESFLRAPEIAVVRRGDYRVVKSFDTGDSDAAKLATVERVDWQAPDGLDMQGWLIRPTGRGPHPLVMNVHGGPIWHWRPQWLGRGATNVVMLLLLRRGYALFLPNPRGSSGRGQAFARGVLGEMGGADTQDVLSGVDHLLKFGIADPRRLGVMGGSYGGYMTAWLITQDSRFRAAVAVSPMTHLVTEHLLSNISHFVALFLGDSYLNSGGKYLQRSPLMHAHRVKTPTLSVCGALDRCTPPEEARQFHTALKEHGVVSALVTYPEEGHGVRSWPAAFDYIARVVSWFEKHLSTQ